MQSLPNVDPAVLDQLRALGGEALVKRLVTLFFESSKGYVSCIVQGIEEGDIEKVEVAAHTLKSGAGSLGARAVHRLAEEVELAARGGEVEKTRRMADELAHVYETTCEELASLLED